MRRLVTDLCVSAAFLADLARTVLVETVRTARAGPANGPIEPLDRPGPAGGITGRVRRALGVRDQRRTPGGNYWFR